MENSRLIQQDNLLESVSEILNILKQQCPDMSVNITLLEEVQVLLTKDNLSSDDSGWLHKTIGYLCHFKCLYDFCPLKLLDGETDQERWVRWGKILDQMRDQANLLCNRVKKKNRKNDCTNKETF